MSTAKQIYEEIFLGEVVDIPLPDISAFNVLRVNLYRQHKLMKEIDNAGLEVCQKWHPENKYGTFWLGKRARSQVEYTILRRNDVSDVDGAEDTPCPPSSDN